MSFYASESSSVQSGPHNYMHHHHHQHRVPIKLPKHQNLPNLSPLHPKPLPISQRSSCSLLHNIILPALGCMQLCTPNTKCTVPNSYRCHIVRPTSMHYAASKLSTILLLQNVINIDSFTILQNKFHISSFIYNVRLYSTLR